MEATISFWLLLSALAPGIMVLLSGFKLWTKSNFVAHRYGGLIFLFQYLTAWYYYYTDYAWYKDSVLPVTLPLNGCIQAISAMYTFTFLSKRQDPGGFFGDKGTMSYNFVKENLFYQMLVVYGSMYYTTRGYRLASSTVLGQLIEAVMIFLPYTVLRPWFPKTHFRDALGNHERNATEGNRSFYWFGIWVIKVFYVLIKHTGFFVTYVRFIDGFTPDEMRILQGWVLANAGTVSIAVFLSTLRFKKVLGPRVAYATYVIMAYFPFYMLLRLAPAFLRHAYLLPVVFVGTAINFMPTYVQNSFQVLLMVLMYASRWGFDLVAHL